MKNKTTIWTLALILIAHTAAAAEINHEITAVSRIVGDTPSDMKTQLMNGSMTLERAGLYSPEIGVEQIINAKYGTSSVKKHSSWTSSDIISQLQNGKNNQMVVRSGDDKNNAPNKIQGISDSSVANWDLSKKNAFIIDSKYAGLMLPTETSFGKRISSKNPIIAPLSHKSNLFARALVCNLGKYASISEDYLNARNNYYLNTRAPPEFLGITLLSYSLYANPLLKLTAPSGDVGTLCNDYDDKYGYQEANQHSIAEKNGVFSKEMTATLDEPAIGDYGNYSLIETGQTSATLIPEEMMLPMKTEVIRFPLKTIITDASATSFEESEEISANIPDWDGENMQDRICYNTSAAPTIDFSQAFSDNEMLVIATINPTEITDCEKGKFKFYKKIKYKISYVPYSPIVIKKINYPLHLSPGETDTAEVLIDNLETSPAEGIFVLLRGEEIISALPVNTTKSAYLLEMTAPLEEGKYDYTVEFRQENQSKTHSSFSSYVSIIDASLEIPETVGSTANVALIITNYLDSSISTTIEHSITDYSSIKSGTKSITLSPGINVIQLTYSDLQKSKIKYGLTVNIPYLDTNKVLTGIITTNHQPTIYQGNVVLKEGAVLKIIPEVQDPDGDDITTSIDAPFKLDGTRTLTFEESGEYTIKISASDGTLNNEKTITLLVENVNRPPELSVADVQGHEGKEIAITATATDPDNENSVDNDDNELMITYGAPFDENGKWTPGYEDAGEIETEITVSDGELTDTKTVTVKIDNYNRPPHLDDLTDMTIKEGEFVYAQKGRDPDNENLVDNDDNTLTHRYFGAPLNHEGKWRTTYDNSGTYTLGVEVSDGEKGARKDVTLTIENVNRPPVITAPDRIEAQGSVDLSVYVTDPDNTNSATNDDNELTITYGGSPFDSNGAWAPTIPDSTVYTTITASDGEFTISKNIYVHVAEVNVQAQQTPPQPIEEIPEPTQETQVSTPPLQTTPTQETEQETAEETVTEESNETEDAPVEETFSIEPTTEPDTQPAIQPTIQTWTAQPQTTQENTPSQPTAEELEVKVKVKSKIVDDGDSVKVKPDDEFKVKIDVRNNAEEEKEIEIEASIDDLDQEEDDSTALDSGDSEDFTYEFEIPRITDDDEYDLNIFVKDGKQTKEWNILLKIDKPSHEILIEQFTITPETVKCGQISAEIKIKLENTGKNDEDGTLHFESSTLRLSENVPFELAEGESRIYTKTLTKLAPGEHTITTRADYGKEKTEETKQLTVEACKQEETKQTQIQPEHPRTSGISAQKTAATVSSHAAGMPAKDIASILFVTLSGLFAVTLIIYIIKIR